MSTAIFLPTEEVFFSEEVFAGSLLPAKTSFVQKRVFYEKKENTHTTTLFILPHNTVGQRPATSASREARSFSLLEKIEY